MNEHKVDPLYIVCGRGGNNFKKFCRKLLFGASSKIINDKIHTLTESDNMPEEIVEAEEYTLDVELKLRLHYRRLQRLNGTRNRKAQTTTSQTLGCSSQPLDTARM